MFIFFSIFTCLKAKYPLIFITVGRGTMQQTLSHASGFVVSTYYLFLVFALTYIFEAMKILKTKEDIPK